ncbi:uncharacterized protein LAJ45_10526 [Morchella importuna]|uniref:uncharacterized protein n=1 Tax=Morchella importuna TaxID=1174673 RepID=UPI001E8D61C8|nr:uncharacterized protein LAJ45_10526 [Morchella importuna]KAH8145405.1 hypothetical protein LAJ45_10526 [Morchella importuna]
MREGQQICWDDNNYSLLRHILTKIFENPDIRLCVWRHPNETRLPLMTRKEAIIKLIEIALPGYVQCDWFIPGTYASAVSSKIGRLYKIYFIHLYPESTSRDELIASKDYRISREKSVWKLLEQLAGDSPGRHGIWAVVKPPKRPEGRLSQKNKVKIVVDLTGMDGDGGGGSPYIKPEASDDSTLAAKPSATLEPAAWKAIPMSVTLRPAENKKHPTLDLVEDLDTLKERKLQKACEHELVIPSIEMTNSITNEATPMSVTPRPAENKKRPALDSGDLDAMEERKLQKGREHELAVLNAKIRLVEAETELAKAKIRIDHQKK